MADSKLSNLTELAVAPATDDEVYIRDVSEAAADESKRITLANLLASLPATTLNGKLTAGASEIEGSNFDINGGTIDGVTITAPALNGVVTTTGLTMPAFSLSGDIAGGGQAITNLGRLDTTQVLGLSSTSFITAKDTDGNVMAFRARDTGIGPAVIGQLVGAADPYFGLGGGNTFKAYLSGKLELSGALTLNGQVFDAGAGGAQINTTGAQRGLLVQSTQDINIGAVLDLRHISSTPAVADTIGQILVQANDAGLARRLYAQVNFQIADVSDGAASGSMSIVLIEGGANNTAMTLSAAGVLAPDHSIMFGEDQDSALVANEVSLGGYDIAPGERSLAISQENPVVVAAAGASDRYLPIRINGATFKLLLHT